MSFLSINPLEPSPPDRLPEFLDPTAYLYERNREKRVMNFHEGVKLRRKAAIAKRRKEMKAICSPVDAEGAIKRAINGCMSQYARSPTLLKKLVKIQQETLEVLSKCATGDAVETVTTAFNARLTAFRLHVLLMQLPVVGAVIGSSAIK